MLACARRGGFGISNAFVSAARERTLAAISTDGVRGGAGHSFSAHLASAEGQAELRCFQERVSTRSKAQIQVLAQGATERSRHADHDTPDNMHLVFAV